MTATETGHPFTRPEGSDVSMFIQWKGTKVCLDFYCPCGVSSHLDSDSPYFVGCTNCNTVYEMGTQVIAKKAEDQSPEGVCWMEADNE